MPRNPKQRPRVEMLTPPYGADTAAALDLLGPPIQLFRVFARRPERARGIAGWGHYYLSRQLALSLRQRELVIDRTTALCEAEYEWGIHIAYFGAKAELTDEQITSLGVGSPDDTCWTEADRAVIRAVDLLHRSSDLDDAAWADLVGAVGEDGAVDTLLLCGWYHAISYAVRALRLPLEPGANRLPANPEAT